MLSRNSKWLLVLLSLVAIATTKAAPTIDNSDSKLTAQPVSPASDLVVSSSALSSPQKGLSNPADNLSVDETGLLSNTGNSALADIAAEFLKPPADFTNSSALPPGTRPLPAVPAALFMGLTGFLCVTLVRDRKFWLTAVTFILWAGQTGIAALPQAASHLVGRKQIGQFSQQQSYSLALQEQSSRLRSELEGTEYIGLLHHLEGIPTLHHTPYAIRYTIYAIRDTHYAIRTQFPYLISAFICLTYDVRQFVCFSPAFIFDNLSRGPPTNLCECCVPYERPFACKAVRSGLI